MRLHEEKEAFKEVVDATAASFNLEEFQVEKDYYVSLLLKKLVETCPDIVFKGGTSLSKCYDVIHRFSEDIDINLKVEERVGRNQKRKFKEDVLRAIEEVGFELLNDKRDPPLEIFSGRDFNEYLAGYRKDFVGGKHMVEHIIVETNVTYRAFPCELLAVSNYITKFLEREREIELIRTYELEPFRMQVQTIDRTFIDKLFALCDYFEEGQSNRYSRHLYDIHMIWESGLIDFEDAKQLVPEVIEVRSPGRNTHSCKPGYRLVDKLETIIEEDFYRRDYETNTKEFLSKYVPYERTIASLTEIIESGLLPKEIGGARA